MLLRVKGSSLADETFECLIEFLRIMRTSQRSVRLLALSRTSLSERCGRSLLTWLKTVREESASADAFTGVNQMKIELQQVLFLSFPRYKFCLLDPFITRSKKWTKFRTLPRLQMCGLF